MDMRGGGLHALSPRCQAPSQAWCFLRQSHGGVEWDSAWTTPPQDKYVLSKSLLWSHLWLLCGSSNP